MKIRTLRWLIITGSLTILVNFGIQLYLLHQAFNESQKKFSQTVHIALLEVLKKMYDQNTENMPQANPVRRVSNDYFVVDVNDHIHAPVLEFYLISEFERFGIRSDFEYGIYDCEHDSMVYGSYIRLNDGEKTDSGEKYLPTYPDLVYYFTVRFPHKQQYIVGSLRIWIIFTIISAGVLVFFVYVILTVLRQRKFSELQRDFINNMTHEFKTPLTSNRIAIEFLQHSRVIKDESRLKKYVDLLAMQNDHLNRLVERMLETSILDKKNFEIDLEEMELVSFLKDIVESFGIRPGEKYEFRSEVDRVMISADHLHLGNCIYSLIDNARKYSLSEEPVVLRVIKKEKWVHVQVSDRGVGIPKAEQSKVFRRFYRISRGDIHNVKGFGLGLYYVKRICVRHGWKVRLDSSPGNGTSVTIIIPVVK